MKIKYKNEPTIVTFGSLKRGDVFRAIDDETIIMKIEIENCAYNAVFLDDGAALGFGDTDEVVLLNATLVIE